MQVFRNVPQFEDDNTEYPSKHNHARHRWQRKYFSDTGPLNYEPTNRPRRAGTAPLGTAQIYGGRNNQLQSLTPNHSSQGQRKKNRGLRHPNSQTQSTPQLLPEQKPYQGIVRYKGASMKYLRYDTDDWNRPGYWPNCRVRQERWDNYRLHQWEDNRYETCSPKMRNKAHNKINKSNRNPFQHTPYSEQSSTMLFYQRKLAMSRSMPTLHKPLTRTHQNERIFDFAATQERLTRPENFEQGNEGDEEGEEAMDERYEEGEQLPDTEADDAADDLTEGVMAQAQA